jgi:hypothetical protein
VAISNDGIAAVASLFRNDHTRLVSEIIFASENNLRHHRIP